MSDSSAIYRKKGTYVIRQMQEDFLVIPLNEGTVEMDSAYLMNETGAFIFECIDGSRTVEDLARLVSESFDTGLSRARDDVRDFIEQIQGRFLH
ncbi:MAG: PqqD family protein [Bacteroidales bacterium]